MLKYKIIMIYDDGKDEQDEIFETSEEAEEYAAYLCGCSRLGADMLHLSNPGDYPETGEEIEEPEYEIIEVEID